MSIKIVNADVVTKKVASGQTVTQYALVKLDTSGTVLETAGTADNDVLVLGVALQGGTEGQAIPIAVLKEGSELPVIADLTDLAIGDKLYTAANGEVTDSNLSGSMVGVALEASDTAGDIIMMSCAKGAAYNLT
jgi:hypothetical protein